MARNETKVKMNPLQNSRTVVGIPAQSSTERGAPIAGVNVLGHGDMAEQPVLKLRKTDSDDS